MFLHQSRASTTRVAGDRRGSWRSSGLRASAHARVGHHRTASRWRFGKQHVGEGREPRRDVPRVWRRVGDERRGEDARALWRHRCAATSATTSVGEQRQPRPRRGDDGEPTSKQARRLDRSTARRARARLRAAAATRRVGPTAATTTTTASTRSRSRSPPAAVQKPRARSYKISSRQFLLVV